MRRKYSFAGISPRTSPFTMTWLPTSLLGLSRIGFIRTSGLDARGLRLHDLGAAHFEAVAGHKAVQRHVLAFERCRFVAILGKNAAERRAQQAFPAPLIVPAP